MVPVLERGKSPRESFFTIEPTPRAKLLRQRQMAPPKRRGVLERQSPIYDLRIITRVSKETEGEPEVIRHAKIFCALARETPIEILPDEPLAGSHAWGIVGESKLGERGHIFGQMAEESAHRFGPVLSDEEMTELREEFIPYWKAHDYLPSIPPELKEAGVTEIWGRPKLGHTVPNWEKLLKKGLLGIKKDAEERLARLDLADPEDIGKLPFLEGVIMALEAGAEIGRRYAAKARELAEREEDTGRKAELLKIAKVCDQVPANPARTFHEALQSIELTYVLLGFDYEGSNNASFEPGRADQYLYPYYESDMREGRITKEQAQELIDCWCLRYSGGLGGQGSNEAAQSTNAEKAMIAPRPGGGGTHDIHIGGLKGDGTDATNELSYMFLEAMMHFPKMLSPQPMLLVHSKTPDDLLIKACQLTSLGGGWPMYINADLLVDNLLARAAIIGGPPLSLEDARQSSAVAGCHEACMAGMDSGWQSGMFSAKSTGRPAGLPGTLLSLLESAVGFESFEELREAFSKEVARQTRISSEAMIIGEAAGLRPSVLHSALTEDCIEKGMAKEQGGARYNVGVGGNLMGSVDVGNSLAAIKKLVFDEKNLTMEQLSRALEKDFEGYEDIRKMCLEAPKFGNDDDYVDEQVAWVIHLVCEETKKYTTTHGGRRFPNQIYLASYILAGSLVGALPSGRLAGEPLSDGISPTLGSDVQGPTSVLKSVGKINNAEVSLSQTLNMKLDPAVFEKEDGLKRLAHLVRVFVDQKVDHAQINVVSADAMRAAQSEPEKYQDLTVKVAGYNARFVVLYKELQDSIIARTEHGL